MEVVKAEILKLLEVEVIYPISDSQWVSLVQVVPKKTGITVMKNKDDELVPTRIQNGWRIAIAPEFQEKATFTCPFGIFAYRHFYRRYIQDFAKITSSMCKLLQKDVPFEFDEPCKMSFDKLKDSLNSAPIIQIPDWSKPFEIMCDASDYVAGAILGQKVGKASHAIY
ncbi:uncharacterized protein [Henckelia pumila]|uniref:uncharacterized protein n=1 Tax=Henckelia pumila TaxID=405737 RepID=UPI003C6E0585